MAKETTLPARTHSLTLTHSHTLSLSPKIVVDSLSHTLTLSHTLPPSPKIVVGFGITNAVAQERWPAWYHATASWLTS